MLRTRILERRSRGCATPGTSDESQRRAARAWRILRPRAPIPPDFNAFARERRVHRTCVQRRQLRAGDAVRIRGERWRIAAESPYDSASTDAVSIVDVDGSDPSNRGTRARFILPFEPLEHLPASCAPPRMVGFARWRHAARASLAAAVPHWTSLRAAARADLAIIPFQLEPALAVTRGDACRLLIADDVGLGKTIQAGLIVAETVTRTPDARVLIVAPAGLRDQWRDELRSRFSLDPEVLDAGGIARAGALLAPDVNPWSVHPIAITSIDFVKRPDVLRSLEALLWDVIVFDEAHTLGGRSDRAAAATALAARARCVVMLTATPHSGDEDAFARLCGLGDLGAEFPLMTFRRTRADVGLPHGRRSILLRVRPTGAEIAMHRALDEYARLITQHSAGTPSGPATGLVAAILTRRACSSASSLARSVERRMALLADNPGPQRDQLTLPFMGADDDDEPGAELGVAGLARRGGRAALARASPFRLRAKHHRVRARFARFSGSWRARTSRHSSSPSTATRCGISRRLSPASTRCSCTAA